MNSVFGSEMREIVYLHKNEKALKKKEGRFGGRWGIRRSIAVVSTPAITKKTCRKMGTYCGGFLYRRYSICTK